MSAEEDEMKEMVGGCNVCSDERGWDENPLVYCDGQGCNVAVHQACYGIVDVPSGPWFCRKCESQERAARVRCELCPCRDGALKRTDQNGWAHVVCALYIPEVRFGNVTTMEPILISLIPAERFNKTCYICEESNRSSKASIGACMTCNKAGCKQSFHVTCAQMSGLLCEEAGNMDNVKYCGYCQYHYGKLVNKKSTKHMKIIPPFRPVPSNASNVDSPVSSPDKSGTKASSEEPKASTTLSAASVQRSLSTPGTNNNSTDNSNSSGKKSSSNPNTTTTDIDTSVGSSKNSKPPKKGNSSGTHSGGSKTTTESTSNKTGNSSIIPKIAQPILTAATFSSTTKSITNEEKSESSGGPKGKSHGKSSTENESSSTKNDESLTIKLERVDNPLKASSHSKKDFTTLQLKEVVSAALDRPMSNAGNKYDHVTSALTGGIEPPLSSGGSGSSHSLSTGRHSHGDKPAPPDIKPHVTLTPIPMRSSSTRINLSRGDENLEVKEDHSKESGSKSKSPINSGALSFHNSFGPPKLQSQQSSPDVECSGGGKILKPPDLSLPDLERTAPPAKRSRASSRDDDRERKTPTKGRGGRRGSANTGYSKRETSNGTFTEENSIDDPMEGNSTASTRGGRSGPGRRPGVSRLSGRPPADDSSTAPTLSQLSAMKSQMESSTDSNTLGALPSHMFGNALNPASSMAQRMVDTLSQEMEAVVAAGAGGIHSDISPQTPLIGISIPGKPNISSVLANGTTLPSTSTSASSSAPPQTLEQLLERQWEQGSQFLMEQAQHLDIAQLLSCLNQLKQDNRALEEHVQSLVQRRDQLIAINARLSIPLGNSSALGALGPGLPLPGFNNPSTNGSSHNGHNGTPPPTLQPQTHLHSSGVKGLQITSSTTSPQQHHELMLQQGRHGHRDDRSFSLPSEMQVARTEIPHGVPSPHHSGHSHNQRAQAVAPYGYSGHPVPVVTSHTPSSSHPHASHHPMSRDTTR